MSSAHSDKSPICSLLVVLDWRARTNQVPVTVCIIKTLRTRPELATVRSTQPLHRVRCPLASVRAVPFIGDEHIERVGRVREDIVVLGHGTGLDVTDLLANGDQGVAEAVELCLGLGLGRLDHESVGDGPRHCGGMEAIVLE